MNVTIEENGSVAPPMVEARPPPTPRSRPRRLLDYRCSKATLDDTVLSQRRDGGNKTIGIDLSSDNDTSNDLHTIDNQRRRRTDLLLNGRDEQVYFCLPRHPRRDSEMNDIPPLDSEVQCGTKHALDSNIVSQTLSGQVKTLQGLGTVLQCRSPQKCPPIPSVVTPKRTSPRKVVDTDGLIGLKGIKALTLKHEGILDASLPSIQTPLPLQDSREISSSPVAPQTPQSEPRRRRIRAPSVDTTAETKSSSSVDHRALDPKPVAPHRVKSDEHLAALAAAATRAACEEQTELTRDISVDFSPIKTSPKTFADKRPSMMEGIVGLSGIRSFAVSPAVKEISVDFSPLQTTPRSMENRRLIGAASVQGVMTPPSATPTCALTTSSGRIQPSMPLSPLDHSPVKKTRRTRYCPGRNRSDGGPKESAIKSRNGQFLVPTRSKSDEGLIHMAMIASITRDKQSRDKPPRPRARTVDEQAIYGPSESPRLNEDISVDFSPEKAPRRGCDDRRRPSLMEELVSLTGGESLVQEVAIDKLVAFQSPSAFGYDAVTSMKRDLMEASYSVEGDRSSVASGVAGSNSACPPSRSRSGGLLKRSSACSRVQQRGLARRHTSECTLNQMASIASEKGEIPSFVPTPSSVAAECGEKQQIALPAWVTSDNKQQQHLKERESLQSLLNELKGFSGDSRKRRVSTTTIGSVGRSNLVPSGVETVKTTDMDVSLHKPTPTLKRNTFEGVNQTKKVIYLDKRSGSGTQSEISGVNEEGKARRRSQQFNESIASILESSMNFDHGGFERRRSRASRVTEQMRESQPLCEPVTPDTSDSLDSVSTSRGKQKSIDSKSASLSPMARSPGSAKRDLLHSDLFNRGRGLGGAGKP